MAFKLAEAFIQLNVNGMQSVTAQINGLRGGLHRLGETRFANGIESGVGRIGNGIRGLTSAATSLQGILAATGAVALGRHAVQLAMDMEQANVSFKVMLGSAADAKKLMSEIMQFAAETPYESPEVINATKSLIAFGSSAKTVIDEVRRMGDIASGVGMPIGELAQIYGKARVQGRLFAEDINQLTGRGIPIIGEISKQLGIADSEVRKYVEKGQVNFSHIETAFKNLTAEGGRFHDMMDEQSKTMAGIASTAQDDLNAALRETGKIIGAVVVPAFAEVAKEVAYISEKIFDANENLENTPKAGSLQATRENVSLDQMEVVSASREKLQAMRDKEAAELKAQRERSMDAVASSNNRKWYNPFDAVGILIDREKMQQADQSIETLKQSLAGIDLQLNILKGAGPKSIIDNALTKPADMATKALAALPDIVNRTVSAMKRGDAEIGRSFGPHFTVKPGQFGYKQDKSAMEAAAKAADDYARRIDALDKAREAGVISQQTHDEKVKEADATLAAAKAKAAQPQYLSAKQYESRARDEFQGEMIRITELQRANQMTAGEAKQAGDKARATLQEHLDKIKLMVAESQRQSVSASGAWAGVFGTNQAEIAMQAHQRQVVNANAVSEQAKKLYDEAITPAERYQKRIKELDKLRDNPNGISQKTYDRLKANADEEFESQFSGPSNATKKYQRQMEDLDRWRKDREARDAKQFKGQPEELAKRRQATADEFARLKRHADDELAQNLGEEKPNFRTKVGQIGNENRLYDERRKELDEQRGKLGEERYNAMVKRLDTAHKYRLADIEDSHRKGTESHGLTEFARHIQASLHKSPEDARREQREKDMLTALQTVATNTNPANQKNQAVVARGGP